VLNPVTGYYRDPVVTLDFGSLYPSCMCELNICASTRLSRATAKFSGLNFTQPPAPDLTGVWFCGTDKVARIHETADDSISVYTFVDKRTRVARYTDQLNESITLPGGDVWALEDGGYALRLSPGEVWHRADRDVLVMVDASVREGVIPMLERTLKLDRKASKKRLAAAEEAGDKAAAVFQDNLQAGIKVLMVRFAGVAASLVR
jgi:DNA polymerase elongation subunit (family B)